jgi:hypothetical protein
MLQGAMQCLAIGQVAEAEAVCRQILAVEPQNVDALHLLGVIASEAQQYGVAIAFIRKAIALEEKRAPFHASLGRAYRFLWRLDAALESCRQALVLDERLADAHYELGATLYQQGDILAAMKSCRHAIELEPDHVKARRKLGSAHLILGDWAAGWEELDAWRDHKPDSRQWRGESLAGAQILLYADQGFGDALQGLRFIPLVVARGGQVVLQVQPELHRLVNGYPATEAVLSRGAEFPECNWRCPLFSLPHVLGTNLSTLPAKVPYVAVPPSVSGSWSTRFVESGLRIGLVWAGKPTHKWDRVRSLPGLSLLEPLGNVEGLTYFSLQKGIAAAQASNPPAGLNLLDLSLHLNDFADTAAAIDALDLIITVDTSVAHLAGALGKPVWILVARAPDWMWMIDREDTPWYPTARLFRQSILGDWESVIKRIAGELRRLANGDRSVLRPKAVALIK